ncbi:MAG: phosphatidate cytidylyltransferase [candidate division WS1 bacterium]|nr:phosphatidate cytidylyltransferase [candidate division WS1 bacterium]
MSPFGAYRKVSLCVGSLMFEPRVLSDGQYRAGLDVADSEAVPKHIETGRTGPTNFWKGPHRMQLFMRALVRATIGLVILAALFGSGYAGGWWFFACVALVTIIALWEYYSALRVRGIRPNAKLGGLCVLLILLIIQYSENMRMALRQAGDVALGLQDLNVIINALHLTFLVLLFCVAGTLVCQFRMRSGESQVANSATTVFGVVYVGLLFSFVLRMRYVDVPALTDLEQASEFARRLGGLTFVIVPVWIADSAAYLVGNLWGRRQVAPHISPGKTLEGSIGGLIGAIAGALVIGSWLGLSLMQSALLGAAMGMVGQLGDLGKSVLKRDLGIKDFGVIFGPHGGVLDRFDAILFSMPLVYWYFWFLVMRVGVY